jgi:hypothetical protein
MLKDSDDIQKAVFRYSEHLRWGLFHRSASQSTILQGLGAYLSAISCDLGWPCDVECVVFPLRRSPMRGYPGADFAVRMGPEPNRLRLLLSKRVLGHGHLHGALGRLPVYQWLFGEAKTIAPGLEGTWVTSIGDWGVAPEISFCSSHPDALLVPDPFFFNSGGFAEVRSRMTGLVGWDDKVAKAFWRGSSTGLRRYWPPAADDDLGWLARLAFCQRCLDPDLAAHVDVGITTWAQIPDPAWIERLELMLPRKPLVPKEHFASYKYVFVLDGNGNSWTSLIEAFITGSCVVRIESERGFRQWYYDRLQPWVHYVPVKADLSDLTETVLWLIDNDDRAREIAARGSEWVGSLDFVDEMEASARRFVSVCERYRMEANDPFCDAVGPSPLALQA